MFVGGVPKLADIGLVVPVAEARSFVGTEGYIPPEGHNSIQADLYSLGKVLYEACMGKDRQDFPEPMTGIRETQDDRLKGNLARRKGLGSQGGWEGGSASSRMTDRREVWRAGRDSNPKPSDP